MKGRKPKPAALHELHGNPSKLNMKTRREPAAPGDLAVAPDWMTEEQKAAWRYAVANAPLGILRAADRGALAVWVVAEDTHRRASTALGSSGLLVRNGDGPAEANPLIHIAHKQALVMIKAAAELGFTPVARARLAGAGVDLPPETPAATQAAAADEFDRHMAQRPRLN